MFGSQRKCLGQFSISRGFTLIELAVTLVVLGLLFTVGGPSFFEWLQNQRIRTGAEAIQNGLQIARAEAVRRNANVEFVLGNGDSGWVVRLQQGATEVQSRAAGDGSARVTTITAPEGSQMLTYNGLGRVEGVNADGSVPFARVDVDLPTSVVAASQSRDLRLTVGAGGEVRMCDPSVSATNDPRKCP